MTRPISEVAAIQGGLLYWANDAAGVTDKSQLALELAPQEHECVRSTALLVSRLSNKEIAEKLFISPETVKRHIYNIYQKLNVSTRHEASKKATALGIIKG